MSLAARETLSAQHASMPSPPESPMREQSIKQKTQASDAIRFRRKEVVDGDVVRTYESRRRRRLSRPADAAPCWRQASKLTTEAREQALQAAMELPSSVLIVQGLRRFLNSDEPLYDELKKEQRAQLQKEFLIDVGAVEHDCKISQRQNFTLPLSPPAWPKGKHSVPLKADGVNEGRICECCRVHCV